MMSGCVYASDLVGSTICKKWMKPQTLHFKQYSRCNKSHNASQRSLPGWTHLICASFCKHTHFYFTDSISTELKQAFRIGGLELVVRPCSFQNPWTREKIFAEYPSKRKNLICMATRSWWFYIMLKRCSMTLSSSMIIYLQDLAGIYCLNGLKENIQQCILTMPVKCPSTWGWTF